MNLPKTKECKSCKSSLPITDFYQRKRKDANGEGYYFASCKKCSYPDKAKRKLTSEKYQSHNKDKLRAALLKRTYGLSWEDYLSFYEEQKGSCAICRKPLKLYQEKEVSGETGVAHVDHCHDTGKVRGLLCRSCNTGIGMLKESSLLCKLAADYLEKGSN